MRSLPKIQPITSGSSYIHSDPDICFRGEHPDERTDKEFLRDLENKLFKKSFEEKEKRKYHKSRVMNINTKVIYQTVAEAERLLNLPRGHVLKKLRTRWKNPRGDKFIYV